MPVLHEFRAPQFPEFEEFGKSLWRLENAYTTVLGDVARRTPALYAKTCIGIQGLLAAIGNPAASSVHAPMPT